MKFSSCRGSVYLASVIIVIIMAVDNMQESKKNEDKALLNYSKKVFWETKPVSIGGTSYSEICILSRGKNVSTVFGPEH